MAVKLNLDQTERRSTAWLKVEKYLQERIEALRDQNDGDHDPIKTAKIRGQIDELKTMLKSQQPLPEHRPVQPLVDSRQL